MSQKMEAPAQNTEIVLDKLNHLKGLCDCLTTVMANFFKQVHLF